MLPKGGNLWVKNAAKESALITEMRKGAKLVIKAASLRGHQSIDTYSLTGFGQALDRLQKECPGK
jgi:invasion protein IalB